MKTRLFTVIGCIIAMLGNTGLGQELKVGEETIKPGITFVFEAAAPDAMFPQGADLAPNEADIHLEARANWSGGTATIPEGAPRGGFVAYLTITAVVTNETTRKSISVSLKPVINLIDNQHYSKNLKLPGAKTDKYTVTFTIAPPASNGFLLHSDYKKQFGAAGDTMFAAQKFSYKGVNFSSVK